MGKRKGVSHKYIRGLGEIRVFEEGEWKLYTQVRSGGHLQKYSETFACTGYVAIQSVSLRYFGKRTKQCYFGRDNLRNSVMGHLAETSELSRRRM